MSIKALESGAADYVPKPSANRLSQSDEFRRELLEKVKTLSARRRRIKGISAPAGGSVAQSSLNRAPARPQASPVPRPQTKPISLRPRTGGRPDLIAIGCSTGGPQALARLFSDLPKERVTQPIIITQHMPPTFTAILAQHLQKQTGWTCYEAEDGMPIVSRQILVAPGDRHMLVDSRDGKHIVKLSDAPPENFCRPSVDPMFRTAVRVFGSKVLGIILTGMGNDGCQGAQAIVGAGGNVVAQDDASSVVWGMPGAVANAGICCAIVPLPRMGDVIARHANGLSS